VARHQSGHSEERAVRQAGDKACGDQGFVGRRDDAGEVAQGEHRHQPQQQGLSRNPRTQRGDHRCADDDAERIRRDDVSGGRFGDAEAGRDVGQQAHRDELGGADPETAECQRQHREPAHRRWRRDDRYRYRRTIE
jgi:hypothetical protein